ncbi:MAG: FkbM family methyltransferase, partial [Pseudomonadota bacterium]
MSNIVFAHDVYDAFETMWTKHCESHGAEVKTAAMASDAAALDMTTRSGVTVSVPATMSELSTYILLEQEDWFEAELPFLRGLAQPGWRMLDVGANYGLYGLTVAKAGGPDVKIAGFEPAARTARFLRRSVDRNGFEGQMTIVQTAMSDDVGEAVLDLRPPELKALTTTGRGETVRTTTIDAWVAENPDFAAPDFVKIDAEGAEAAILAGGEAFFAKADPLVMIEVKHGGDYNYAALDKLVSLGYALYALIPGLNLLAPADPRAARLSPEALDGYCINLFGVKPTRRAALAEMGVLVETRAAAPDVVDENDWAAAIEQRPFWAGFAALKADFVDPGKALPGSTEYKRALAQFAMAENADASPADRLATLEAAKRDMEKALGYRRSPARRVTAARIAVLRGRRLPGKRNLHRSQRQTAHHQRDADRLDFRGQLELQFGIVDLYVMTCCHCLLLCLRLFFFLQQA